MRKIITKGLNLKGINSFIVVFILSTLHVTLSFLVSFKSTWDTGDYIKAAWQPPDYVFYTVWPILYLLLAVINFASYYSKKINMESKVEIFYQSTIEAIGQTFWLIVFNRVIYDFDWIVDKYDVQYYLSTPIIILLCIFAWVYRLRTLLKTNKILALLYIPYTLWISFASILNLQILFKYIFS